MLLDNLPDTIPLTTAEKTRLVELETVIETHLEGFLLTGKCLAEIRSRRLYRTQYPSFDSYLKSRWCMPVWKANELIGSFSCYALLLDTTGAPQGATPLPDHIPEGPMREIAKLDGKELKSQVWRLVPTYCRSQGASLRSVAHQVSHMVRAAVEEAEPEKGVSPKPLARVAPKMVFVRSILQLSRESFDVQLATLQLTREQEALTVYRACQLVSAHCAQVQAHLLTRYPQCHPEPANESPASNGWAAHN